MNVVAGCMWKGWRKMSKWYEDDCVGCDIGCIGSACSNRRVAHYDCDECTDEFVPSELYDYEGEMLCSKCLLDRFTTIADKE